MLVRRLSRLLATAVLALAFVALTGVAGGSEANAQGRYYNNYRYRQELRQREALRRYQLRQRFFYGNSRAWGETGASTVTLITMDTGDTGAHPFTVVGNKSKPATLRQ